MNLTNKKAMVCIVLAVVLLLTTVLPMVACTKEGKYYDNEENALVFSSQDVDQVFNPFFSTTGADSNVIGPTQVSMLTNDKDGNIAYGDNETVVTKDFEQRESTEKDKDGKPLTTTYYFVLKNDIRFSNGSSLTIKDVLFNMYVYLDPAYTGSSTMYSTDIVGLKAYRTQQENKEWQDKYFEQFERKAITRINALIDATDYVQEQASDDGDMLTEQTFRQALVAYAADEENENTDFLVADYDKAIEYFKKELVDDYKNSKDAWQEFVLRDKNNKEHKQPFANDNEMFLYNEGYITWNPKGDKGDGNGTIDWGSFSDRDATAKMSETEIRQFVFDDVVPDKFVQVITGWQTANTLFDYIVNDEMERSVDANERKFPNITGIKFANMDESVTVNGNVYPKAYETKKDSSGNVVGGEFIKDTYQVLSVTINGVDPKAIWNFAFSVAPMYYYSSTGWAKEEGGVKKDYIKAFNFVNEFGVEYASQSFMNEVVKDPAKIGVPVGAGPYAASKASGGIENISNGDFYDKAVIYYERNPYYDFTGASVAKIKKIRYKVVSEQQMLNSLYQGDIHFAEPNAKQEKIDEINARRNKKEPYDHTEIETSGYGYIGINAGKVPSIKVRQAIMHTMDTSETTKYYRGMAEPIYRSMSKSSWAYPKGCTAYYPYIGDPIPEDLDVVNPDYKAFVEYKGKKAGEMFKSDEQKEFIYGLIKAGGMDGLSNPWISDTNAGAVFNGNVLEIDGAALDYVFTIAGETDDHPAFTTMYKSSQFLNEVGFSTYVTTDSNALSKLSSGDLTVWAAAWGSTIDPDMYQVYHKDSKATSVLNWGYKQIKISPNKYVEETRLINLLSDAIDEGRSTTDTTKRAQAYKKALNLVMELAVELPTYQRQDMFVYNTSFIDTSTFNTDTSSFKGLTSDIHLLSLVVKER